LEVQLHTFLTLALDGSKWAVSRPGERAPSTYWIGGWMDPRHSGKEKESLPHPGQKPHPCCPASS